MAKIDIRTEEFSWVRSDEDPYNKAFQKTRSI